MGLILAIIIVTPLLGFVALIGFDKSGEFSESDNLFLKIIMCYAAGVLVYLGYYLLYYYFHLLQVNLID